MAYSSQGSHTGQLDFCNWQADAFSCNTDDKLWQVLYLFATIYILGMKVNHNVPTCSFLLDTDESTAAVSARIKMLEIIIAMIKN